MAAEDQVDEVVKRLTASFPGFDLMKNNQHLLHLLLEGTSVAENRDTGESSPSVRFIDFGNPASNDFTAVCQFKLRVPGTEYHILPDIVLFLNGRRTNYASWWTASASGCTRNSTMRRNTNPCRTHPARNW